MARPGSRTLATLFGFSAVLMWDILALLTMLALILAGLAEPGFAVGIACILITTGAIIAARNLLFRTAAAMS